ncbi:NADPH-dependent 7-cyano-7-deazaguanine reductase QueF [Alteromonas aestuariivivens]|uniref:NADPH-dependent 7-cyano-7-deazaguanine reductase n=1 Tax=Alteromonas aestuariivivens TaxID=1938339 RepID=A0A3D8M4C7_9ALTE|nr:NADPH-dependent 7-cyano-7-deazaguanine reductase QueF [Alteromonas aestuariivivens]RDV24384.1 NADPH-dependent 7-cyano-7-deazaguanine reductase QueF [Alteromonas aestuariivivens]
MTDSSTSNLFPLPEHLTLGKTVQYEEHYNPKLLQNVPRALGRSTLNFDESNLPFMGVDIWNGYELSWLNMKGKPNVAILECRVPITSPNLVESKSFKLYLNSFNQTRFNSVDEVRQCLEKDLSDCAGESVAVTIYQAHQFSKLSMGEMNGTLIDDLDIEVTRYQPDKTLVSTCDHEVEETLVSHLLKSNCLITSQPDWASIQIHYKGKGIEHESLLKYLIAFRQHNEFHEQCVERIFCDLMEQCQPEKLAVYARYTRRGGLDINPFRANFDACIGNERHARQ